MKGILEEKTNRKSYEMFCSWEMIGRSVARPVVKLSTLVRVEANRSGGQ